MRNGYFGIFRCIALVVGIGIGFNLIGGLILLLLYGTDVKGGSPSIIVIVNAAAQLLMMLGLPILIARSTDQNYFTAFRLEGMSESRLSLHLIGIPIIVVAQFVGEAFDALWKIGISQFPDLSQTLISFQKQIEDMMSGLTTAHNPSELAILLFGVAIVPAFAEESFFRGFIMTNIERSGKGKPRPVTAVIISSILFAAMHVNPMAFPGLLTIGLLLGWLAYRTCDLRVSALAHAFNNGAVVILAYLFRNNTELTQNLTGSGDLSLTESLQWLAVSLPILFGLLYIFHKMTETIDARNNAYRAIAEHNSGEEVLAG
jgi:membrane protease YdiL (CAAX protease family)